MHWKSDSDIRNSTYSKLESLLKIMRLMLIHFKVWVIKSCGCQIEKKTSWWGEYSILKKALLKFFSDFLLERCWMVNVNSAVIGGPQGCEQGEQQYIQYSLKFWHWSLCHICKPMLLAINDISCSSIPMFLRQQSCMQTWWTPTCLIHALNVHMQKSKDTTSTCKRVFLS